MTKIRGSANNISLHESRLAIVMPCLNDAASITVLIPKIIESLDEARIDYRIVISDDGSKETEIDYIRKFIDVNPKVELLICGYKSGHQNAILRGLTHVESIPNYSPDVVIMDSDGEDNPGHILVLLEELKKTSDVAVLARRGTRYSGLQFITLYKLFNWPFRLLTGRKLETGNFMAIKASWVSTLINLPSASNHISATVLRFSPAYKLITLDRGKRYVGKSRMNVSSLSLHGYGALATFADVALSRLVIGIAATGSMLMATAIILILLKTFADVHFLPGWTSNAVIQLFSLTLVTAVQAVTTTIIILWTKSTRK
jgi:glycosyltransferase involved in cell wall biosynthesis